MKRMLIPAVLILALYLQSCEEYKQKELKSNVENTINTYLTSMLSGSEPETTVGRINIISIDTSSSKDILYAQIIKLGDSLKSAIELSNILTEDSKAKTNTYSAYVDLAKTGAASSRVVEIHKSAMEYALKEIKYRNNSIKELNNRKDSLLKRYNSGLIDSTDFVYYHVLANLCLLKKHEKVCSDSLPFTITKDFKIKK